MGRLQAWSSVLQSNITNFAVSIVGQCRPGSNNAADTRSGAVGLQSIRSLPHRTLAVLQQYMGMLACKQQLAEGPVERKVQFCGDD